jgi:uncharacterized membrane protein
MADHRGPVPDKETGRLEAFSDGVFAIAMTLLALELKVPHLEEPSVAGLSRALGAQWPSYFAFATSFFTVLIMWVHHDRILRTVHRADPALLFANGFLLFLVTAVPFPTAVVAAYLETPAAPAACTLYAGTFFGISIAFYIFLRHALRRSSHPESMRRLKSGYNLGPPLYLAATLAAPFSVWLSLGICTGLWIFWAVTTREC